MWNFCGNCHVIIFQSRSPISITQRDVCFIVIDFEVLFRRYRPLTIPWDLDITRIWRIPPLPEISPSAGSFSKFFTSYPEKWRSVIKSFITPCDRIALRLNLPLPITGVHLATLSPRKPSPLPLEGRWNLFSGSMKSKIKNYKIVSAIIVHHNFLTNRNYP